MIEKNQVMNWLGGIVALGANPTVSKNLVSQTHEGISATGGDILGNVVVGADTGIRLFGPAPGDARAIGNGIYGNTSIGIDVARAPSAGMVTVTKNNIFGTVFNLCGLRTFDADVDATGNYWGSATARARPSG